MDEAGWRNIGLVLYDLFNTSLGFYIFPPQMAVSGVDDDEENFLV